MDWAENAAIDIPNSDDFSDGQIRDIAAALRAAELRGRASGMREAADTFCAEYESGISAFSTYETVYAAASKLSPT